MSAKIGNHYRRLSWMVRPSGSTLKALSTGLGAVGHPNFLQCERYRHSISGLSISEILARSAVGIRIGSIFFITFNTQPMQNDPFHWTDYIFLILWYLWEVYKYIVVGGVTMFLVFFLIVGGHFQAEIYWSRVTDLWKSITGK